MIPSSRFTRRSLLRGSLAGGAILWAGESGHADDSAVLPVAGVVTAYRRNTHADVLIGKILAGYRQDGGRGPRLKLASLFVDQLGPKDLSQALAEKHGFRLARSIDEALTLGSERLQVAGVLSIGEHGDYPYTADTKQHQYPRRAFFEAIAATFRRCGQVVPVFNDKHLSYRHDDARFMVETARQMKFPLLAGSSVPVAWREPALELPRGCEVEAALTVGYGGLESYGFHALEAHQAMLERRRGGETGVSSVQAVRQEEIRRAESAGRWSRELLTAVLDRVPTAKRGGDWIDRDNSAMYLLEHRDGLRSAVAMANGAATGFGFAARIKGQAEPVATWFKLDSAAPYTHFAFLLHAIDETFHSGRAVYPVERTLLTTGILDRVMHSLAAGGTRFETPELAVAYTPTDWPFANHPQSTLKLTAGTFLLPSFLS